MSFGPYYTSVYSHIAQMRLDLRGFLEGGASFALWTTSCRGKRDPGIEERRLYNTVGGERKVVKGTDLVDD